MRYNLNCEYMRMVKVPLMDHLEWKVMHNVISKMKHNSTISVYINYTWYVIVLDFFKSSRLVQIDPRNEGPKNCRCFVSQFQGKGLNGKRMTSTKKDCGSKFADANDLHT